MKIKQFISKHKIISAIIGVVIFLVLVFALIGPLPLSGYYLEFDYLNPYYVALEPVCDEGAYSSRFLLGCFYFDTFRVKVNSVMNEVEIQEFGEKNGWYIVMGLNIWGVWRSEEEQITSFIVTIPDVTTRREHKRAKKMLKNHPQIIDVKPVLDYGPYGPD